MKLFSSPIAIAIVLMTTLAQSTFADSVTCQYFYNPIKDIAPIEARTPNLSNNPVLTILKDVLSQHFNIRTITPEMTVQSFENYLELIDPTQIFISKEDLNRIKYPEKSFFETLHLSWFNEHTRPEYKYLFSLARDRMDSYIERFLNDHAFRDRILTRANVFRESADWNVSDRRPETPSDIETKVVDYLAGSLANLSPMTDKTTDRKLRHADLAKLIRKFRAVIEGHKENIDEEAMTAIITKSFLSTFDAHTSMYLPRETRLSLDVSKTTKTNIGIKFGFHNDGFSIAEVSPGGVAEKSGVLKNDILLAIEPVANSGKWFATRRLTMGGLAQFLAGEPNANLRMRILRDSKEYVVELTRQLTSSGERSVDAAEIRKTSAGSIMSIKLSSFSAGSALALKKEIAKNKTSDVKGLILDLRGNLGGNLIQMSNIVQLFAGRADSMLVRGRNSVSTERSEINGATIWDGPLVILVDHDSASASEALSAALQAHKRAIVVGGPATFGKGSMQNYVEVGNTMYRYTTSLFYSPTGKPLQWDGVKVDIPLVSTESESNPFSERFYPNSIKPTPLGGPASSISYKIPNLDAINKSLVEKSKGRNLADQAEGKSIKEIHNLNTDEAYRIVEDWIQLENKNKM